MRGDRLRFADPQYIQKLRIGVWCLIVGFLVSLIFKDLPPSIFRLSWGYHFFWLHGIYRLLGTPIIHLSIAAGAWLIATPNSSDDSDQPILKWKFAIRIIAICLPVLAVVLWLFENGPLPLAAQFDFPIEIGAILIWCAVYFSVFSLIRRLYLRIPDEFQARLALVFAYSLSSMLLIFAIFLCAILISPRLFLMTIFTLWGRILNPVNFAIEIFALWYLHRFAMRLKEEHQAAESGWAGQKPPLHGV
jgi:hypothetical protein